MKTKKKGHHVRKGPIFYAKSSEDQKKGHHVRKGPIFYAKSSEDQKKGHHVRRGPIFSAKSSMEKKNHQISYKRVMFISTSHPLGYGYPWLKTTALKGYTPSCRKASCESQAAPAMHRHTTPSTLQSCQSSLTFLV